MLKKLLLLLATVEIIFTACEGGESVEEENGGTPSMPKIELSQQSIEVDFESAQHSVSVTSPYSWKATSKNDWIVVDTKSGIAGTKELKFSVKRNEELEIREGTIVIKNEDYNLVAELYVTQTAFVSAITIETKSLTFAAEGGTQEVAITANFEYEFSTRANWLTIKKSEKGITVTAQNYAEVKERTAEIIISSEKYGVSKVVKATQGAFVSAITIEPESLTFAAEGSTQEVVITANFEYEFSTNADWLTIKKSENGVMVNAKANANFEERTTKIIISSEKYSISKVVNVTQGASAPAITIELESLTFAAEGSTQEVVITANFEYEFSTNADWLTIKKSENGVMVNAKVNASFEKRTAEIIISSEKYGVSKVVNVTQGAFVPELTVSPESLNFTFEGGTQEIAITANFEYAYIVNADWLTIKKSESGIKVTANANANFEERTAEITISSEKYGISKTIAVTQKGVSAESQNIILYTSSDGKKVEVYTPNFRENIVSNTYHNGQGVIIFDAPVTWIGNWAFDNRDSLTSITIPNSVTTIGSGAFANCDSLTSITIPDSVTSIGNVAFSRCTSLTSITIGNSVTSIEDGAFFGCTSLTSVTIPDSVTSIGSSAFSGCTSLTSITIGNGVTSIGESAFYNCTGELTVNCNIPSASSYEYGAFYGSKFTKVTIGNGVTTIGSYAFYYCTSLTSITIPDSVTSIGNSAFYGCTSLTSITIPDSVTSIGNYAFSNCSSLTSVTIPNSVTSIGNYAFYRCTSLTSVTIPDSVTSIGKGAFYICSSLTSVYCKPTTPPTGGYNMFYNNASGLKIYVPRNSVSAYKAKQYWIDHASCIVGYDF